MTDTITIPRGEFAAYQKALDRAKDEIAQLAMERDEALSSRDQALMVAATERVARTRADTVIATLREWRAGDVSASSLTIALAQYDAALRGVGELFPPPPTTTPEDAERQARQAMGVVGRLKRLGEDGRP